MWIPILPQTAEISVCFLKWICRLDIFIEGGKYLCILKVGCLEIMYQKLRSAKKIRIHPIFKMSWGVKLHHVLFSYIWWRVKFLSIYPPNKEHLGVFFQGSSNTKRKRRMPFKSKGNNPPWFYYPWLILGTVNTFLCLHMSFNAKLSHSHGVIEQGNKSFSPTSPCQPICNIYTSPTASIWPI